MLGCEYENRTEISHPNDFSSESELDEDAVAAYYAVRIDKSQGLTITAAAAEGRYDKVLQYFSKFRHLYLFETD